MNDEGRLLSLQVRACPIPTHLEGHPKIGEVLGADAWQCGLFEVGQAQTLQAMGRIDAAAAAYANAEVVLAKSLGTDHPRTQRVRELRAALAAPP